MILKWADPFVQMIADEAHRQFGRTFIPRTGEGQEMENPPAGLEVENWTGWLVPDDRAEEARSHMPMNFDWFEDQGFEFIWVFWEAQLGNKVGIRFDIIQE